MVKISFLQNTHVFGSFVYGTRLASVSLSHIQSLTSKVTSLQLLFPFLFLARRRKCPKKSRRKCFIIKRCYKRRRICVCVKRRYGDETGNDYQMSDEMAEDEPEELEETSNGKF